VSLPPFDFEIRGCPAATAATPATEQEECSNCSKGPLCDSSPHLEPADRSTWPRYVLDLERKARETCGSHASDRQVQAELLFLAGASAEGWTVLDPPLRDEVDLVVDLPDDLRRWPAGARYRVATLERAGASRSEAVEQVRAAWRGGAA